MTKLADLEDDVAQFKEAASARLDKLELAVETLTSETRQTATEARQTATEARQAAATADQRHTELLAILRTLQPHSTTSPPTTTTLPPPTLPLTTLPLPHPTTAVSHPVFRPTHPSYTHGRTNPLSAPFTQSTDSFGPTATMPITQPLILTSDLVFDEFGLPIPTTGQPLTYPEVNSSFSNSYYMPHRTESSGPRYGYSHYGAHGTPPHGPRVLENKVWVPGADHRLRKLKMPIFEGEDVYGWIYRVERFFDIQGLTTSVERLRAAVLCMEGQALSWYRWSDNRVPFRTWEHLKSSMLDRFQPSHEGDIYEQFLALEQEGSVREYIGAFETLAAQLVNIPEKVMEGTFIKGLKPEIRSSVRMLQPTGLTAMIKTALLSEEGRSTKVGDQVREVARVSPPPPLLGSTGLKPVTEPTRPPLKRMTEAEFLEKRAKGLCFKCNGRFGPGHRCPDKALQVLLIDDDDEASAGEEEPGGKHHAA